MHLEVPSGFATQVFFSEKPLPEFLPASPWLLLGDESVRSAWRSFGMPEPPVSSWVATSEASKRIEALLPWLEQWSASHISRNHILVVIGGGVMTDMGGLAASLYMRGISWHSWPTSLLGQIDAGIGGKTGVNLDSGKNMAGAFHHPERAVIVSKFLDSLPQRHLLSGKWELIKMALIEGDSAWAESMLDCKAPSAGDMERAIKCKMAITQSDFKDKSNRRVLNLGHTLGHALEAASGFDLLHGEAVGLGTLAACLLSESANIGAFPPSLIEKMTAMLAPLSPRIPSWEKSLRFLMRDKKIEKGEDIGFIVPVPGSAPLKKIISPESLESVYAKLLLMTSPH